jgi:hypothetical protein
VSSNSVDIPLRIEEANREVVRRLTEPEVLWVGVGRALDVIPGMKRDLILHAGPPIEWAEMAAVQRESVLGAVIFEGLAPNRDTALDVVESGGVTLAPCHRYQTVGAMTGVTSASMAMLIGQNSEFGNLAFCKVVERELQFGVHNDDVFENLRWLQGTLGKALDSALSLIEGVPLVGLIAKALHMGDECHNRNVAATALTLRTLAEPIARVAPPDALPAILGYFDRIDQAFLGLAMTTAKALTDSAAVPDSTVVTALARNGVTVGIKVGGLGDRWITGPAQEIDGAFLPGYGPDDATRDIGDSALVETIGLGGMAMANAPTAGAISGGTAEDAIRRTRANMEIAAGRSRSFTMPILDFEGTPVGIDVRRVVESGTLPYVLTGVAGNQAPWGRIGAGVVRPPMEVFVQALEALNAVL